MNAASQYSELKQALQMLLLFPVQVVVSHV